MLKKLPKRKILFLINGFRLESIEGLFEPEIGNYLKLGSEFINTTDQNVNPIQKQKIEDVLTHRKIKN